MSRRDSSELQRATIRLSLQFTAFIVVLLSLVGVLVYSLAAAGSTAAARETLEDAVDLSNARDAPLDVFLAVYDRGRLAVSRDMPAGLPVEDALAEVAAGGGSREETVSVGGATYQVLTVRRGNDVVQAAVDTRESRNELQRLVLVLVGTILGAAVIAAAFSVLAARAAIRPLARALALQRRFVADASHELRTPLTLLSTRAQLLRRRLDRGNSGGGLGAGAGTGTGPEPEKWLQDGLAEIVSDAGVLTGILEDLLVSADPRRNETVEPVDLTAVVRDVADSFESMAGERGLQLEVRAPQGPVAVRGVRAAFQRLVTSLLANAVDYAGSAVRLTVEPVGREAVLTVADDGPGLPPELEGRLFERFSSVRAASPVEPAEGAGPQRHYGLGLALAAEIAARFGGSIRAESSPGAGTSLRVRLPLSPPGSQA
ncbi:HAMP domain-containing histidine kinase [Arthrobacter sp. zg-Y411]|uniref:sensor histidine kinase n=1 Tax=Arthrobacter zhangbolii TaxID=2886936 RepID=UPI001D13A2F7|nr:HAMP domain-containing sensor histidine kinase [Arthrobacter zhangbolii]MCC3294416.1 HAMP domain-containing histidine kinase [Arthrobacter zhangbolii]